MSKKCIINHHNQLNLASLSEACLIGTWLKRLMVRSWCSVLPPVFFGIGTKENFNWSPVWHWHMTISACHPANEWCFLCHDHPQFSTSPSMLPFHPLHQSCHPSWNAPYTYWQKSESPLAILSMPYSINHIFINSSKFTSSTKTNKHTPSWLWWRNDIENGHFCTFRPIFLILTLRLTAIVCLPRVRIFTRWPCFMARVSTRWTCPGLASRDMNGRCSMKNRLITTTWCPTPPSCNSSTTPPLSSGNRTSLSPRYGFVT